MSALDALGVLVGVMVILAGGVFLVGVLIERLFR